MKLMADHADVVPDVWYRHAFEELEAQAHIGIEANGMGHDCHATLSADGRFYVREQRREQA